MKRLLIFEYKRIKKTKVLYLAWLLCIIIAVVGMVLNRLFYGDTADSSRKMLSIFNSYTQFSYLILGFLFVTTFTKDSLNGITSFYKQIGFSYTKQYFGKMIVLFVCIVPVIALITLICNFIYGNSNLNYLFVLLVAIIMSQVYIMLLAILISLVFKNTVKAVLLFYGLFIIFNILNIGCFGLINPADSNSILTFCLTNWVEKGMSHYSLDKVSDFVLKNKAIICYLEPLAWCIILVISDIIILKRKDSYK